MQHYVKTRLLEQQVPVSFKPVMVQVTLCIPISVQLNLYRYTLRVFAQNNAGFCIFTQFSSTNLLQFVPYQTSTMESTQNNFKCGLELIKTLFSQVRAFPQNPNQKNEVRVLIFLTLASSNLFLYVVWSLRSKK